MKRIGSFFIILILTGSTFLHCIPAFGQEAYETIIARQNEIKKGLFEDGYLTVDMQKFELLCEGRTISCEGFEFENITYVPLREICRLLNTDVGYIEEYRVVDIKKGVLPSETAAEEKKYYNDTNHTETAYVGDIPVYFGNREIAVNTVTSHYIPESFNCNGTIYMPVKKVVSLFHYNFKISDKGIISIYQLSDKLKKLESTPELRASAYWIMLDEQDNRISDELVEEVLTWEEYLYEQPNKVIEQSSYRILYEGRPVIVVGTFATAWSYYQIWDSNYGNDAFYEVLE